MPTRRAVIFLPEWFIAETVTVKTSCGFVQGRSFILLRSFEWADARRKAPAFRKLRIALYGKRLAVERKTIGLRTCVVISKKTTQARASRQLFRNVSLHHEISLPRL